MLTKSFYTLFLILYIFRLEAQTVDVVSIDFKGDNQALAFFKMMPNDSFVMTHGMVMATGNAEMGLGQNDRNAFSTALDPTQCPTILDQTGRALYDAVVLEMEVVPQFDELVLSYIFASEEYGKSVCSRTQDLFEITIRKINETAEEEVMLNMIPNSKDMVNIHSVSDRFCPEIGIDHHPEMYVDNLDGRYLQYNGFTQVMEAAANVIPGETYMITIRLADVGDKYFDSAIILPEDAFFSRPKQKTIQKNTLPKIQQKDVNVQLSPSIAHTYTKVQSDEVLRDVTLYNVLGHVLQNQKINDRETNIDVQSLPPGQYYIHLKTESGNEIVKTLTIEH